MDTEQGQGTGRKRAQSLGCDHVPWARLAEASPVHLSGSQAWPVSVPFLFLSLPSCLTCPLPLFVSASHVSPVPSLFSSHVLAAPMCSHMLSRGAPRCPFPLLPLQFSCFSHVRVVHVCVLLVRVCERACVYGGQEQMPAIFLSRSPAYVLLLDLSHLFVVCV